MTRQNARYIFRQAADYTSSCNPGDHAFCDVPVLEFPAKGPHFKLNRW